MLYTEPLAYFITFTTRRSWLHGDERGSISRDGTYISPNKKLQERDLKFCQSEAFLMNHEQREIVHDSITAFCEKKDWYIYALNVRSNHLHIVVCARTVSVEEAAKNLKAIATQHLRKKGQIPNDFKPWTEKSSTRYALNRTELQNIINYIENQ